MTEEKKHREFWLYEASQNASKRSIKYVREAIDQWKDIFPTPQSPWLRKLPPLKLIEVSALEELKADIEFQKQRYYKLDEINTCLNEKITQLKSKQSQYESTMLEIIRVRDEYKDECERLQNKYDFQLLVKDRERLKADLENRKKLVENIVDSLEWAMDNATMDPSDQRLIKQRLDVYKLCISKLETKV